MCASEHDTDTKGINYGNSVKNISRVIYINLNNKYDYRETVHVYM